MHKEPLFQQLQQEMQCNTEQQRANAQQCLSSAHGGAADASKQHSRMSPFHKLLSKLWNIISQALVIAVTVFFLMWQSFKALMSKWSQLPSKGQFRSKRNFSVNAEVDVLSYCAKEWKGELLRAKKMRKAYEELFWNHQIKRLRSVKDDHYCALRAVLFQVFIQGIPFPSWMKEKDILKLPEKLLYSQGCNWIQQFSFGPEKYTGPKVYTKLRKCLEDLKSQWMEVCAAKDHCGRQKLCKAIFSDEAKENTLYEAVKFIMLYLVIDAYENMKTEQDFPVFLNYLFSRDTSSDPLSFMMNHLNSVGDTTGIEQVDMFLIGHALEVKIKVYRLHKFDTEDFLLFYPVDYKRDWHEICLLTEDDRHYKIPVRPK
ncbi:inactive ubiquitin thioesterase OTULINL [Bombina bombina]|uniref:inactive ubiquitin thioesterase OTULINL n=1 Tax=Bombina bombina TaxID=8345 RepID=UPI00235ADF30|nr:inactive ubiquitin thioesterase OTULINL [Bombina bombina]